MMTDDAAGLAGRTPTQEGSKKKANISQDDLLSWDQFSDKPPAASLRGVYERAWASSLKARHWYWVSIRAKRHMSLCARVASYLLGAAGVVAPLLSALSSDTALRLLVTQLGVASIAVATVIQVGDRVFGWSSGWLRYTTTVTALETLTLRFQLAWADYFLLHPGKPSEADVRPLFDLAKQLQLAVQKAVDDETQGWVAEFAAGTAALGEVLKSQRETHDKESLRMRQKLAVHEAEEKGEGPVLPVLKRGT